MARLLENGAMDTSFPPANGGGADGSVFDITLQLDGKVIVTGDFTKFNGVTRNRITRLEADGTTDPSINFGAGANAFIARSIIQPDRMIVLGGGFSEFNQQPRQRIVRLHGGSLAGSGGVEFTKPFFSATETSGEGEIFVRRIGGTVGTVAVEYQTIPGSATEGVDYQPTNGVLNFPEGEVLSSFKIRIEDDREVELDESMLAFLTIPADGGGGVVLGPQPVATLSIVSDDSLFEFAAASFSVNEGVSGGNAAVQVLRRGSLLGTATVDYLSLGGTATPNTDYEPVIGTLTFGPGEASKSILIPVFEDVLIEGNETVQLELANPTGQAALGLSSATLQIVDNDFAPGEVSFSALNFTVNEYETNAVITVERRNGSTGVISVNYTTANLTALA
ncbi:MAG TPA: Calx-beta domain-containing protein, partial [Verrucomicrobiae bacterium]|nr:Calx-beta domain-containing protein [Verrucomicrobiae bacterium]